MTLSQFILVSAFITTALGLYLFLWQWIRRDGIARIFFLIFAGTLVFSGLTRFTCQILRIFDILDPKQASYFTAYNVSITQLLPLIAIVAIIMFYKRKK